MNPTHSGWCWQVKTMVVHVEAVNHRSCSRVAIYVFGCVYSTAKNWYHCFSKLVLSFRVNKIIRELVHYFFWFQHRLRRLHGLEESASLIWWFKSRWRFQRWLAYLGRQKAFIISWFIAVKKVLVIAHVLQKCNSSQCFLCRLSIFVCLMLLRQGIFDSFVLKLSFLLKVLVTKLKSCIRQARLFKVFNLTLNDIFGINC